MRYGGICRRAGHWASACFYNQNGKTYNPGKAVGNHKNYKGGKAKGDGKGNYQKGNQGKVKGKRDKGKHKNTRGVYATNYDSQGWAE